VLKEFEEKDNKLCKEDQEKVDENKFTFKTPYSHDNFELAHKPEPTSVNYQDMVVVYFNQTENDVSRNDEETHPYRTVLNELQFIKLISKDFSDGVLQRIYYIQTCVNAKIGLGKKIVLNYFATINNKKTKYNFRKYPNDKHLSKTNIRAYCQKQILQM
jgi:hypothetical protein